MFCNSWDTYLSWALFGTRTLRQSRTNRTIRLIGFIRMTSHPKKSQTRSYNKFKTRWLWPLVHCPIGVKSSREAVRFCYLSKRDDSISAAPPLVLHGLSYGYKRSEMRSLKDKEHRVWVHGVTIATNFVSADLSTKESAYRGVKSYWIGRSRCWR